MIRIFSYLPNPRVWKALIAAELCGVDVEVIGDKPGALASWLWDFDARPLEEHERTEDSPFARTSRRGFSGTLYKTDEFIKAQPFGTVPAAFSSDGSIGIFESNSILRAVVRASDTDHGLYGREHFVASRIDSFLDATLVFAREAQVYLLAAAEMTDETYVRMSAAFEFYLNGIEQALSENSHIACDELTIADIALSCDVAQFLRERLMADRLAKNDFEPISRNLETDYPRVTGYLRRLAGSPVFKKYLAETIAQTLPEGP
ncbi:MAG: glutathione S-transferase [Pseudomonadales bacterium]|jgi:glutathione S-transferase|nr:glutathione S-transferase [Pseudomonadales bacterium]